MEWCCCWIVENEEKGSGLAVHEHDVQPENQRDGEPHGGWNFLLDVGQRKAKVKEMMKIQSRRKRPWLMVVW